MPVVIQKVRSFLYKKIVEALVKKMLTDGAGPVSLRAATEERGYLPVDDKVRWAVRVVAGCRDNAGTTG